MTMETEIAPPATGRILLVDDEASILAALRRLLRTRGYEIFSANSGAEGLLILERESIDVVISDMRMPEMTGAQFLEHVFSRWPDVKRILLTGYSDVESTVAAVNRGKIWRYIPKPWDDEDLLLTVQQALAHRQLMDENRHLVTELKALNTTLEKRVDERTAQLQQALKTMRQSFVNTVHVFSNMMDLRGGALAGHSRRVAEHARKVAKQLGMEETAAQDTFLAALLHDIGKLGLPDAAMEQPFNALGSELRAEVMKHPAKGEMLLMPIPQLAGAAALIRDHHEQFDGHGYPSGKSGLDIPLGARILAAVNDYDALQLGLLATRKLTPSEALHYLVENSGKRYDPDVVDAFSAVLTETHPDTFAEVTLRPASLKLGLRLSRDLLHREGYLLLPKDHIITAADINQLMRLEATEFHPLTLYVVK
ncbi:MAG TPA: HD domain-containing phosphohydrolase [Gallionella sp.]|nr:HD domain-containing phosphohydrolase [Gallionella sp.]